MMRIAGRAAAALVLVLASQIAFIALLPNGFGGDGLNLLSPSHHAPEEAPTGENPLLGIHDSDGITSVPRGNSFSFAQNFDDGILNPASVEKVAHSSADSASARTDQPGAVLTNLEFDDARDWKASEAEISVWNLTRLYAVNGTFDDGFAGVNVNPNGSVLFHPYNWDATSSDPGSDQTQIASYYATDRKYILVENQGESFHPVQPKYEHFNETEILWNQTIDNSPAVTQFKLSFDFLYARGPLTKPGGSPLSGNCSVVAYVDGSVVWNSSLLVLDSRDVWYRTGEILVTLPTAKSRFNLEIGLRIDEYLFLDGELDYDNDGADDSILNTAYISVRFDDILFVGASPPGFDEVDLQFRVGGDAVPITGTAGEGATSVVNASFWRVSPVAVELTSNTSVYFDYQASLLVHRFENSTWTADNTKEGVSYSVELGENPQLVLYAFVSSVAGYDNFSLQLSYPDDWANVTVLDPYFDVTSQCSVSPGLVEIPYSLVTGLGWWKLALEAPNYAESITPQKFDSSWVNDTLYRSGNKTRALIEIGTETNTPPVLDLVNTSWYMPNGTLWSDDTISGGVSGVITSSSYGLGALNTSAGEWSVEVSWTNGTEIAYDSAAFEVHHAANLTALESHIVTESGSIVMNFIHYRDAENGEYLMDDSATILANWSGSTKEFYPNNIHLYWEPATPFDTSLVGPGNSSVLVLASQDFFDNASCSFIIEVTYTDNELIIYDLAVDVGLFDTYVCQFYFEDRYGNYLEGASVDVVVSGPGGGLVVNWSSFTDQGFGNYSISFATLLSGTYQVTIAAEADFYEPAEATLLLYVGEISTGLEILNGTAGLVPYGKNFSLVVRYTNSTGHGIENADITMASVTPDGGVNASASIDEGEGFYSLVLTPLDADDFTILVRANITNYQTQIERFTLSVAPIPTDLHTVSGNSSASVVFGTVYELEVRYATTPEDVDIDLASIQVEFTSVEELNWTVVPSGGGYILRIEADELGRWELTITAQKALHQTGSILFVLFVTENPTSLVVPPIPSSVFIGDISSYVFTYQIANGTGIVDASVIVSGIDPDWVSNTSIGDGNYNITIEANQTGTFSLKITFSKHGYQTFDQSVMFQVNRIPLVIEMATPTWVVASDFTFSLTLTDDAGRPVSDAFVNYAITQGGIDLHIGVMTEDSDSKGTYIATISESPVQWTGNQLYSLEISISKENHLGVEYQVNIIEYMPPGYEVEMFINTVVPQLAVAIVALVSLVIGRRMYRADKRKKALAILAIKRRFEDIRGILGIIVIHKTSGLGIYSKILKGGFDEGMMSAFITAITHFRTEFEMEELHWEFNVVPISDIISIVPTRNLLCAFIVGSRPTMTLEDRMVGFARSVGAMFDETMAAPPREVIDDATQGLFDYLFDDIMDGALLRQYRVKKDAPYPRSQKCLQTYLKAYPPEDGFGLDTLADGMAMCGIQEGNVYRQIIDAIENGILESIDPQEKYPGFRKDDDESADSEPADL